jgi:hypothetical protein
LFVAINRFRILRLHYEKPDLSNWIVIGVAVDIGAE